MISENPFLRLQLISLFLKYNFAILKYNLRIPHISEIHFTLSEIQVDSLKFKL